MMDTLRINHNGTAQATNIATFHNLLNDWSAKGLCNTHMNVNIKLVISFFFFNLTTKLLYSSSTAAKNKKSKLLLLSIRNKDFFKYLWTDVQRFAIRNE